MSTLAISAISHTIVILFMYFCILKVYMKTVDAKDAPEVAGFAIAFSIIVAVIAAAYGIFVGVLIQRFGK